MVAMLDDPLWGVDEIAEALTLSSDQVYRLMRAGDIRSLRLGVRGGAIRARKSDVEDYVSRQAAEPPLAMEPRRRGRPRKIIRA